MKERPVILYRLRPKATFTETFCNICCNAMYMCHAGTCSSRPSSAGPSNLRDTVRHNYMKAKSINEYILGWNPDVARLAQHVAGYCLYTGVVVTVILSPFPCKWRCLGPWGVPRWRELQRRPQSLFIRLHRFIIWSTTNHSPTKQFFS